MAKQMRTKTEYDFNRLKELQWVVGMGVAPEETRRTRAVMALIGSVSILIGAVLMHFFHLIVPELIFFCLGGFFLLWAAFFFFLRAVTAAWTMKLHQRSVVNEFIFEKDNILVYLEQQNARYPYSKCKRVLEAEQAFYVILEQGQGLMMDKSNVSGGTVDDLRAWLEEKCEAKTEWAGRGKQPS